MKPRVHLLAGGIALAIGLAVLFFGVSYARAKEEAYVHSMAPLRLNQSHVGRAWQQAAASQPDLLLVFGSSEMLNEDTPYRASDFFGRYPTGFTVYEVARPGMTSLDMLQDIASLGPTLRGKKVVISFTPSMFLLPEEKDRAYAANFSVLHGLETVFSPSLSRETRRRAAQSMSAYPDVLQKDEVLQFAVRHLAGASLPNRVLYDLSMPIGWLDIGVVRAQDHWEAMRFLQRRSPGLAPPQRVAQQPDWPRLAAQAEAEQRQASSNNPYGVENRFWENHYAGFKPAVSGSGDAEFIHKLEISDEWNNFDLLLRVLKEVGAEPLLMSRPVNGPLWQAANGVSPQARLYYYQSIENEAQKFGFAWVDYRQYDMDPYFSTDAASHPSRKGWVIVDETLDDFFHDRLR
jgi:D-alanyl-lipoteichoic acid biosynthesis protein DltD